MHFAVLPFGKHAFTKSTHSPAASSVSKLSYALRTAAATSRINSPSSSLSAKPVLFRMSLSPRYSPSGYQKVHEVNTCCPATPSHHSKSLSNRLYLMGPHTLDAEWILTCPLHYPHPWKHVWHGSCDQTSAASTRDMPSFT